jgi:DNA-binding transcriptional LysR family regulator
MPDIIERFSKKYSGIQLDIYEGGYLDVINWIKNRDVDFGLLSTSCTTDLPVEPIYRDPLVCIVQKNFITETPGYITIKEMANQRFVIQSAGSDADVQMLFQKYGLHFHSYCHVLDDTSIMAMVACGRGISIMPTMTAKGLEGDLKVLQLIPEESRMIGLSAINKETLSPAAEALYDFIAEYAKGMKHM